MHKLHRWLIATALALAPSLAPHLAHAHAQLRSSDPPVGGTVGRAPTQVEITFSEAVEPRFSTIIVKDGSGKEVDRKDVHVLSGDAHHLAVSVSPLAAGEYRVEWHATSVDTHKTEGTYSFTVTP
jgi:methionine-rich copper-binding protein CopC